jgi:hypothetical protein
MGYTAGRGWIEALRHDHANHLLGLRLNDWTSVIVFLFGAALFLLRRRAHHDSLWGSITSARPVGGVSQAAERYSLIRPPKISVRRMASPT